MGYKVTEAEVMNTKFFLESWTNASSIRDLKNDVVYNIRLALEDDAIMILTGMSPLQYRKLREYFERELGV